MSLVMRKPPFAYAKTKTQISFAVTAYMSLVMRKLALTYARTKMQISFAVTAKLISAFVFAT